jgi:hypothetical protein
MPIKREVAHSNRDTLVTPSISSPSLCFLATASYYLVREAIGESMKIGCVPALVAITLIGKAASSPAHATEIAIEQMPATLETQFALSAAPPKLRDRATVYLLDPMKGYHLSRQGTSGVTCLVQRTDWELADFRNDIYIPLCYDAVGTKVYLKTIMDAAALRAQGMNPAALKAEIRKRYRDKTYGAPEKAGLSYMVGPLMRTEGPPDMKVHTMAMPHLMFYAPYLTDEDIGAVPDLSDHSSLLYPFIDKHTGDIPQQSYMIQLIGDAEKAKILADEKPLIDELCAYREVLCMTPEGHSANH